MQKLIIRIKNSLLHNMLSQSGSPRVGGGTLPWGGGTLPWGGGRRSSKVFETKLLTENINSNSVSVG